MNKPRLIDANELIKAMDKRFSKIENDNDFIDNTIAHGFCEVDLLIHNSPTAYDIGKVVEQLEEASYGFEGLEYIDLDQAIEIVKGNCCENGNSSEGGAK